MSEAKEMDEAGVTVTMVDEPQQQEMWEQPKQEISLTQMDKEVTELRSLKETYDLAKADSTNKYKDYQSQQYKVSEILKAAGKTEYVCEGIGKVTISEAMSVTTPKSPDEKKAFFEWIRTNMGDDAYYTYMSVNSQSLNRLYREKTEEAADRGELLNIDGLDAPTTNTKVSFTKR